MKAEELFVGALVRVNRDGLCIKKDTIVEVRAVDADDKLVEKGLIGSAHCRPLDDNQFEGGIWCEYLDPLPLTPEILEKNGFEARGYEELALEDDKYFFALQKGVDGINAFWWEMFCSPIIPINHIHELQHCLKLVGIEKKIEL